MFEVSERIAIAQPVEQVRAQFGDVAYHASAGVHRGVTFSVVADRDDYCDYEQTTRMGPMHIRQSFQLNRTDLARQVNTVVAGAFAPGSITFEIVPEGDGTSVTATLRAPLRGPVALFSPVLRRALGRSLAKALAEDRRNLESGTYAAAQIQEGRPRPPSITQPEPG
jgi:hypothetical protein